MAAKSKTPARVVLLIGTLLQLLVSNELVNMLGKCVQREPHNVEEVAFDALHESCCAALYSIGSCFPKGFTCTHAQWADVQRRSMHVSVLQS